MAIGFPTKANWSAGDILTAAQMDDLAGTVNLLQNSAFPIVAGKNAIIDGAMDFWQRGVSVAVAASTTNSYTADRFCLTTATNEASTVSQQLTSDTTNLPNIKYCARVQRNSGQTGTSSIYFDQSIETLNSIPLVGKIVTLSFYARAGSNFSAGSNSVGAQIITGTGTDQNLNSVTGASILSSTGNILSTTFQRFTITATIPTTATQVFLRFLFTPVGTAGANDYFEITGVQLELGSVATTFSRAGGSIGGELALCQRYYYRLGGAANYETFAQAVWTSTTAGTGFIKTAQTLRTNNPSVEFASLRALVYSTVGVATNSVSNVTLAQNANGNFFNLSVTAAGSMVTGFTGWIDSNGTTAGYLALSSEL